MNLTQTTTCQIEMDDLLDFEYKQNDFFHIFRFVTFGKYKLRYFSRFSHTPSRREEMEDFLNLEHQQN